MGKKIFIFFCFFLIGLHAQAQQLGFKIPDGTKKVRVPFELHHNLIVIPVILNNILPLRFVLDTGVRTTIITEKTFTDILKLNYDKHIVISGAGGEKLVDAYITNGVTLEIPGVKGEGHALLVLENDYIEMSNFLGTQVNGIFGYEVFSRFIVDINFETKILTLIKPEYFKPKRKYHSLPITIEDTKPYIFANIKQQNGESLDVKLMVDTGASHGLLIEQESNEKIHVPQNNIISTIGRGLGGDLKGKIARVNTLTFANYEFDEVITTYPDPYSYVDSLKRGDIYRNGTLGGEVASRFNLIFDYPNEILYLKKNSKFNKKFEYNISGVVVKATGPWLREFVIDQVREGSSAAIAGLKKGDKIISINNIGVFDSSLERVIGYFNSKHNRLVTMVIERNGEQIKKKFRLQRQI